MKHHGFSYLLILIIFIGLVLRLIALDTRGIQYDDAFTILLAERGFTEIINGTSADTMPPLFYILLHYWQYVSAAIWWQRLLPIILNLLAIVFLFLSTRNIFGKLPAIIAVFILAISPLMIYHAQDIRMYSLVIVCLAGYLYFFQRWERDDYTLQRPLPIIGIVFCGALALYSHNLAIFSIIAINAYLLISRRWLGLIRLVILQVVMLFFFIPWLIHVPTQLEKIQQAFWTPRPGIVEVLQSTVLITSNLPIQDKYIGFSLFTGISLVIIMIYSVIKNKLKPGELLFFTIAFFPPALMFIISHFIRPIFVPRGFLLSYMAIAALIGRLLFQVKPRWIGWGLLSLVVISSIVTLSGQYSFDHFPRSPFTKMVNSLSASVAENNIILHDNKLSYFPSYVYDRQLPQAYLDDPHGSFNDTLSEQTENALDLHPVLSLDDAIRGREKVYYVVFTQAIKEYISLGLTGHPNLEYLDRKMPQVEHFSWNDLEVYVYEDK